MEERERESERAREREKGRSDAEGAASERTLESLVLGSLECNSCDKPANLARMALD